MSILIAAVISTLHLEGPVTADGGDYLLVPFEVPAGTVEIEIAHSDGSDPVILDWGVWSPDGFRGWGGGLTDPAVIGVDESSRGYLEGPITPGTWTFVIGKAKLAGGDAMYVADFTFRDAPTLTPLPRAPFDPVVLESGARWYAGDLHVHSEESGDAIATLDQIASLARDQGLDFVVVTDHNTVSHHGRLAASQPALDDLLWVRGIEVTTYAGHGNAIGVSAYVDHRAGEGGVGATTISAEIAAQGGVFSVNHPALDLGDTCIGCAWGHDDTDWTEVSAIEIQTGPFEVTALLFTPQAIALWDSVLDDGHRVGAVGGSDDHRAGMMESGTQSPVGNPTTLVWAEELSEAAIVEGIRAGRTVVKLRGPDDPMVDLTAETADGGVARLGDTVTGVGLARLTAHVTGGAGANLQIWRDGEEIDSVSIDGDDWTRTLEYPVSGEPERYRVEIETGAGRTTVTSHLWIDGDPSLAPDGGGCCDSGGRGSPGTLLLAVVVLGCAAWRPRQRPRRRRNPPTR
jgi:hypothetical protein